MSQQTVCDGCGKRLDWKDGQGHERVVVAGERVSGLAAELAGLNMRNIRPGRFDWCGTCAVIAFTAVQQATVPLTRVTP